MNPRINPKLHKRVTLYNLAEQRGIPESILHSINDMHGYLYIGLESRKVTISGKLKLSKKVIAAISLLLSLIMLKASHLVHHQTKLQF